VCARVFLAGAELPICIYGVAPLWWTATVVTHVSWGEMGQLGLLANLLVFASAAGLVWFAGDRLTRNVDAIAERMRLSRAFLGFAVLATVTQLPELVTNSTAALRGTAHLLLNSMFGGVGLQTTVLVLADLVALRYTLTYLSLSPSNLAQAALLIALLGVVLAVTVTGDLRLPGGVGLGPIILVVLYALVIWLVWDLQFRSPWRPSGETGSAEQHAQITNRKIRGRSSARLAGSVVLAAFGILLAGVALVLSAEGIAELSGLGNSFIGATLLATATSLPEVSTTLTAVRLGRHSMAVADIFGSNLIMIALLFPSDLLYREGVLLNEADTSARFALALGIVLTAIYLTGLIVRQPRRFLRLGVDSWLVLITYAAGIGCLYSLRLPA